MDVDCHVMQRKRRTGKLFGFGIGKYLPGSFVLVVGEGMEGRSCWLTEP